MIWAGGVPVGLEQAQLIDFSCGFAVQAHLLSFLTCACDFQAQITHLQAELKRLLAKMPRRVRETISELDKKILYVYD